MRSTATITVTGHVLIRDAVSKAVLLDKMNSVHAENLSEALALSLANRPGGHVHQMAFGNGASTDNGIGALTYFPPNVTGQDARLYNETYRKVVDDQSPLNLDYENNRIGVLHTQNLPFSDMVVTCTLDFNEPSGQQAFDDATDSEGDFVFDELGLISYDSSGSGKLLSHCVFHPIQKVMNRSIEVIYTVRILLS